MISTSVAVARHAEDLVIIALAHAFATFTIAGPQQPVADHVSARAARRSLRLRDAPGWTRGSRPDARSGSKSAPSDSIGVHALPAQQVVQLRVNQLDALPVGARVLARVDRQRAVEVVDDEQQLVQQIDDRLIGLLAALAFDALAVVVELGGLAQPAVVVVVALALERCRVGRSSPRAVGWDRWRPAMAPPGRCPSC